MPIATLLLAAMAASTDSPPAAASAQPTTQQQFDAATAAFDAHRCQEAVDAFGALESRPAVAHNPQVLAVVRVRRASCLARLDRFDEATDELQSAMPSLSADRAGDREDLVTAHMALGRIAYLSFDYDNATREFQAARALATGTDAYDPLVWLARSQMFDAGDGAESAAQEALRMATADPAMKPAGLAPIHTLHARVLLNHGQLAAAQTELAKALDARGGLTTKVALDDIVTRSDFAIVAMLSDHKEQARKYLAFTGAGHFEKSPFSSAASMDLPPCGGPAQLDPDDFAIVEFSIGNDGSVGRVTPIYASRLGPVAAEFARAVSGWSWKPEDAQAIPGFFRLVTRVELRCSTTSQHPQVLAQLAPALSEWMQGHGLARFPEGGTRAATVAQAKAALGGAPAGSLAALPALLALAESPIEPPAERREWLLQARPLLAGAGAPVAALTWVDVKASEAMARERVDRRRHRDYLRSLLARPDVAADARAAGTLRLLVAEPTYGLAAPGDAAALLEATANDPALPANDPLRIGALVRLATLQADHGELAAARASIEKSGLAEQQCSLVDATPAARYLGGQDDFPREAVEWGFEGWVAVQFDIRADGHTTHRRAVVAYPPLVFRDSALRAIEDSRFQQSYRPGGGLGCGGKQIKVSYQFGR